MDPLFSPSLKYKHFKKSSQDFDQIHIPSLIFFFYEYIKGEFNA
jgi:hypothetical protein